MSIPCTLLGHVDGEMVSRVASGEGGYLKLVNRRHNSLQGNSQALYVVHGFSLNITNLDTAINGAVPMPCLQSSRPFHRFNSGAISF